MSYEKSKIKVLPNYVIFRIQCLFNNTRIIVVDETSQNVLLWDSAGRQGFKGSKRSTPFAAIQASAAIARKAVQMGAKRCHILVSGPHMSKNVAIKAIAESGIEVSYISDVTPIIHNGCKPQKPRRV